jgi:hypothetical protein
LRIAILPGEEMSIAGPKEFGIAEKRWFVRQLAFLKRVPITGIA